MGKVEISQRLAQRAKVKVRLMKVRRIARRSQRLSQRLAAKLPRHVSSGPKGLVTKGIVVRFFTIPKPSQQRSQRRLRQQMLRQQLQSLLQQVVSSAFRLRVTQDSSACMQILKSSIRSFVRFFIAIVSIISGLIHPQGVAETATLHCQFSCRFGPGQTPLATLHFRPQEPGLEGGVLDHSRQMKKIDTLHNGWSSLQCPGAPAVLYHDPQALIAQPKASNHISLERIADSGAGRDLASLRAFSDQGIQDSIIRSSTQATSPVEFEIGLW